MIIISNLQKSYSKDGERFLVLDEINFEIKKSDFIALMGKSGSGKTTLINTISGLDNFDNGNVIYNNIHFEELNEDQLSDIRLNEFGFIFQDASFIDILTIKENIFLPNQFVKSDKSIEIEEYKSLLGIQDTMNQYPSQVSGGELQRATILRALINNPNILFADEPTGSIDILNTKIVMETLKKLNKDGLTIIFATHDNFVASYAKKIIFLKDKKIEGTLNLEEISEKNRQNEINKFINITGKY